MRVPVDSVAMTERWVEQVRQPALALRGYAVVQNGPDAVVGEIDRRGYWADGIEIANAIQQRWDPAGVLAFG